MRLLIFIVLTGMILAGFSCSRSESSGEKQIFIPLSADSLPLVFPVNKSDLVDKLLRHEASLRFVENQLPDEPSAWARYKSWLQNEIIKKAGVVIDHKLPVDMREKGSVRMKDYTIRKIIFQTRPGIYATANLFIPEGKGPFPAVINMLGHWQKGKIDNTGPQAVGHTLAANGYVCLTVDPWGAGERSTKHGTFEYHGSNLGASLMNIGEPLIGIQISDNIRGVDLLCSLAVVDPARIGATGASGGGNQTMWLSAVDERIRADVPVVSVGSFESYIMESNCICEQLPDGLTFTEEAGIIALSNAPLVINHDKDSNPTFFPSETRRTIEHASRIFRMTGREKDIAFRHFDLQHGYEKEDREAMLGWFDCKLKGNGNGTPRKELPFRQVPESELMVFQEGTRDTIVVTTGNYCRNKGNELRNRLLDTKHFDADLKRAELKELLRIDGKLEIDKIYQFSPTIIWKRLAIGSKDKRLLPLLLIAPQDEARGYFIIASPLGKNEISRTVIDSLRKTGAGIVLADLTGTGELASTNSVLFDKLSRLHTLSRAELWLGRTVIGEWTKEIDLITQYLYYDYNARKVSIYGYGESGLAGLFYASLGGKVETVVLKNAPVSYLFDNRENIDYFSMGIHIPGILKWGDISLAAALTGRSIEFTGPVTMSGTPVSKDKLAGIIEEFRQIRTKCGTKGSTVFN
jgi:hypothetical protein